MDRIPIAVLGASGYSGIEATRILAQHPRAELRVVASDRWQGVTVDAASGTTGAGRKASEEMSFTEVMDDFRAYRVLRHQHTPEISQAFSRAAGREVPLTFTAHLLPLRRGILATCYARLADGKTAADAVTALSHNYATEPFL